MQVVHARCCGLDIHKKTVVAGVLLTSANGHVHREVRTFGTMTADLLLLADWLTACEVTQVAMESTGVDGSRRESSGARCSTCSKTRRARSWW
jgi:hypothetical protein